MKMDQGLSYPWSTSFLDIYYIKADLKSDASTHQIGKKQDRWRASSLPWEFNKHQTESFNSRQHLTLEVNSVMVVRCWRLPSLSDCHLSWLLAHSWTRFPSWLKKVYIETGKLPKYHLLRKGSPRVLLSFQTFKEQIISMQYKLSLNSKKIIIIK